EGRTGNAGWAVGRQLRVEGRIAHRRNNQNIGWCKSRCNISEGLTCGREVRCRQCVLNRRGATLNQLAPLFIPEEERLLLIGVVNPRNIEWTSDVEAVDVVVQLRALRRYGIVLVLPTVGVEGGGRIDLQDVPGEVPRP